MYFPFFKPQTGGKRSAIQPQTIYSEFPWILIRCAEHHPEGKAMVTDCDRRESPEGATPVTSVTGSQ